MIHCVNAQNATSILHATHNRFWDDAVPMAATTALEPALGLIAICSSTLMPLFKKGLWRFEDKDEERGGTSGASHAKNTVGAATTSREKSSKSRKGIMVETSWFVEGEGEGILPGEQTENGDVSPSHKVTIGV